MNQNQKMLFMAGFPRAGSTLLANILAQNPYFHATPTSGLIGSVLSIRDNWRNNDIYKASGEQYLYPRIQSMIRNMMLGHYEAELLEGRMPIDKNRSWAGQIDLLDDLFQCKVKIIYPIRHIGDCVISMEKVNRKSSLNNHGDNGNYLNERTSVGRAENFIKDEGIFGAQLVQLREMINRKELERFVFVPYNDMLTYPKEMFASIYHYLGLPPFVHNFENIKQVIQEQDIHHGFAPGSLHTIKQGKLERPQPRDLSIFNNDYIKKIENERFGDITKFINDISTVKGVL